MANLNRVYTENNEKRQRHMGTPRGYFYNSVYKPVRDAQSLYSNINDPIMNIYTSEEELQNNSVIVHTDTHGELIDSYECVPPNTMICFLAPINYITFLYFNSNQKDFISFKCEIELKDNNPQNKIKLIDSILNSISLAPTITMQTVYIQLAAEKLNIDENILLRELELKRDKINKKIYYGNKEKTNHDKIKNNEIQSSIEENTLSRLLLNYGNKNIIIDSKKITVAELIINELSVDGISFSFPPFKKIIQEYQIFIDKGEVPEIHYFIQHEDSELAQITSKIMVEKHKINRWDKKNIKVKKEEEILNQLVEEALIRFKLKRLDEMKSLILKNISSMDDENKKLELIKFNKLSVLYRELYRKIGREC